MLTKDFRNPLEIIRHYNAVVCVLRIVAKVNAKRHFEFDGNLRIEGDCLQTVIFYDVLSKMVVNLLAVLTQSEDQRDLSVQQCECLRGALLCV
jgi:hypothetical protein